MPTDPEVAAMANALHDLDDDVQFMRRDARNFTGFARRLIKDLAEAGFEIRPTGTPWWWASIDAALKSEGTADAD